MEIKNNFKSYKLNLSEDLKNVEISKKKFNTFAKKHLHGRVKEDESHFLLSVESIKEFLEILEDKKIDGVQIYLGLDENDNLELIFDGTNSSKKISLNDELMANINGTAFWTRGQKEMPPVPCERGVINCHPQLKPKPKLEM